MGAKGSQTRNLIKKRAYELFAEKGFNAVTMKDLCEVTGLSRGGLYRHFGSTKEVFEDIFFDLVDTQENDFYQKMKSNIPATQILGDILKQLREEMLDSKNSLSLAIYEYTNSGNRDFFSGLNETGIKRWKSLIEYGIERNEFKSVNVSQVVDVILYSYQGVRMWSRVMPLGEETADHIVDAVREMLTK